MKKKAVTLLISLTLASGVLGCGDAKATNADVAQPQEIQQTQEQGQEVKQEEQQQETQQEDDVEIGKEYSDENIVIKVEDKTEEYFLDLEQYQKTQGTITTTEEVPIYCKQGYKIGHINPNVTIEITECGVNSAWYRFENPIEGTPFDYIYVSMFMTDMSNVEVLPGTILQGDYNFEIKDAYTADEVQGIFMNILIHYGMISNYSKFDSDDGIMVYVPLKDTVTWAEEKKDLFLEQGVTYFKMEGYGSLTDVCGVVKLQIQNAEKTFTEEELKQFFQSDVDLEIQKQVDEYNN